jgi:hypothetical protein
MDQSLGNLRYRNTVVDFNVLLGARRHRRILSLLRVLNNGDAAAILDRP